MSEICPICSLPKDICRCQELAKTEQRIKVSVEKSQNSKRDVRAEVVQRTASSFFKETTALTSRTYLAILGFPPTTSISLNASCL
jgi:translation initiation factor 1 (eIF-1/SUI1)